VYGYKKYCRLWMYASDALQAPLKGHEEIVANSPICLADDVLVLHRLRALVSNLWHPHHAGNSFAWEGEQDLAFWFSRSEVSRLTGLEQAIIWSPTVNLLLRLASTWLTGQKSRVPMEKSSLRRPRSSGRNNTMC
jgi:hypothetical protein